MGADKEAAELYAAGEGKMGTDKAVFAAYLKNNGHDLGHAIKKEMGGDKGRAFMTIFQSIKDPNEYWAEVLYKSMKGLGTDDRTLIRTICDRCEQDLGAIKKVYTKKYGKTLFSAVKSETSGDYERMLLALIGTSE